MSDIELKYGFRHDPMAWAENDESAEGALVRKRVFGKAAPGDDEKMQAEIEKILGGQLPDGRLDGHEVHGYQFTAGKLSRLALLGCDADRPEVARGVAAIVGKGKPNQADPLGIYDVRALCLLGLAERAEFRAVVRDGLRRILDREDEWGGPSKGCPWTPIEHLITLWHGRKHAETEETVARWAKRLAAEANGAGCWSFKDPWGFVRLASEVDHPAARELALKEVPVILRGQKADGGWGDRSFPVYRALHLHGLLGSLAKLPPLPADWKVLRTIPAPSADCISLAWDGQRLWTIIKAAAEAVAISPTDGEILHRVKLPAEKVGGLDWWDGGLVFTEKAPKRLVKIDAQTGEVQRTIGLEHMEWINGVARVGKRLVVGDGFLGCGVIVDPDRPDRPERRVLGGPIPAHLTGEGDAVWHVDVWAPAMIKSDLGGHGRLLDWGEKPFDGRCYGLAHDGKKLWALDRDKARICLIEKAEAA